MKQYQVDKIIECAKRLVEHSDAKLGGCLSEDSKSSEIPSNAISHVKARHLAALRNALKSEICSELPPSNPQPIEQVKIRKW